MIKSGFIPDPRLIKWTHDVARQKLYAKVEDQLDKLWHDIDNGLLGAQAKTGDFYTSIKAVKDAHPVGSVHEPYKDLPAPDGSNTPPVMPPPTVVDTLSQKAGS